MKPIKVSLRTVKQPFKYYNAEVTIYAPEWLKELLQEFSKQIGLPEKPLSLSICHRREASPIHRVITLEQTKFAEYRNSYLFLEQKEPEKNKKIEIYYIDKDGKAEKVKSFLAELSNFIDEQTIREIISKHDSKATEVIERFKMEIKGRALDLPDLERLARNEGYNVTGKIDFESYQGTLTDSQVYDLKKLARQAILIGKNKAVGSGGYGCAFEKNENPEPVYIIDLAGLQFQQNYNDGGLVLIPEPSLCKSGLFSSAVFPQETSLATQIFTKVVGEKKATFEECKKDPSRYIPVKLNGIDNIYLDAVAYQRFVANDVVLTLTSLFEHLKKDEAFKLENKKILFKFLKYGTGFFAEKLEPKRILDNYIGEAVFLGLQTVFETHKEDAKKYLGHISLPFYNKDELLEKLCNDNEIRCDFDKADGLKNHIDKTTLIVASTNTGDIHAGLGNEIGRDGHPPSVDAAIAQNLADYGNSFSPVLNQTMSSKFINVPTVLFNSTKILKENPTSLRIRDLFLNHLSVEDRKEIVFSIVDNKLITTIDLRGDHKLSRDLYLKLLGSKKFTKVYIDWKDIIKLKEFAFFDVYNNHEKNHISFDNDNLLKEIKDVSVVKEIRMHEIMERLLSDDERKKDETSLFLLKILNDKSIERSHKSTIIACVCQDKMNAFFGKDIYELILEFSLIKSLDDKNRDLLVKIVECKNINELVNIKEEFNNHLAQMSQLLSVMERLNNPSLDQVKLKLSICIQVLIDNRNHVLTNILKEETPDFSGVGKLLNEKELKKFCNDLLAVDKKVNVTWQDVSSMFTEKEFVSLKDKCILKTDDHDMLQAIKFCLSHGKFSSSPENKNLSSLFNKKITAFEIPKLQQILADSKASDYLKLIAIQSLMLEVKSDEKSEFYYFYENIKKLISAKIAEHKLTEKRLGLEDRIKNIDKRTDIITLNKLRDDCHNYCSNLVFECSTAQNSISFQESQENLMKQSKELINEFYVKVNFKTRPFEHKEIEKDEVIKDIENLTNLKKLCEELKVDETDVKDLSELITAMTRLKDCDPFKYGLADNICYEILQRKACLPHLKGCLNLLSHTLNNEGVNKALNIIASLEKEIKNHFFYEQKIAIVFERSEKGHLVMHIADPLKRNFFLQSIEQQEILPEFIKAQPKQYELSKSENGKFYTPVSMTDKALHFPTCSAKEGEMVVFGNHAKSFSKLFTLFADVETGREGKQERKTFFHKIHWHCGNGTKKDKLYFDDNIKTDECIVIMESGDYFKLPKKQIYFENFAKEPVKEVVTEELLIKLSK